MKQVPAIDADEARTLCEIKLCLDNDAEFHKRPTGYWAERAVAAAGINGYTRPLLNRVLSGLMVELGKPNMFAADPWFDSMFDPADPRQVVQKAPPKTAAKRDQLDTPGASKNVLLFDDSLSALIHTELQELHARAIASGVLLPTSDELNAIKQPLLTEVYGRRKYRGFTSTQPTQVPKDPAMSTSPAPIKIETRVFIDGVPASSLTIDTLHQKVRDQEAHIKSLEQIENKSKKLAAEIEKRKASITALNDYIDSLPDA